MMDKWNTNGRNILSTDCNHDYAEVKVRQVKQDGWWGETYYDGNITTVSLSTNVPVEYRKHVVCHELGHVLGLPHNDDPDSCMNVDREYPEPSEKDLKRAAENPWKPREAACTSLGMVAQC